MPNIEPFEHYSDEYDEWFENNRDLYEAEVEAIRQLLPQNTGRTGEIGVGSGRFSAPLGIPIGVEPSGRMAMNAKKRGIVVCRGVAEALPFFHDCLDVLVMVTTICFVDDVRQSFREAFRVVQTGGCLIVAFIDRESDLGRQYAATQETNPFYAKAVFFSTQEVRSSLEEAGFDPVSIKQTVLSGDSSTSISDGFGKGAFVVIKGMKQERQLRQ